MIYEEKTISSEHIYKGKIIEVKVDTVAMPEGKTAARELVKHPGGVGVIAVTEEDEIILVKQFRKPLDAAIYEIPAGKLDPGEGHEVCGKRELEEETGLKAKNFEYLGFIYPSPGFTDEVTHMYLATGLYAGVIHPDQDEYLDIEKVKIDHVRKMIMNNEINDAKTVAGFFKAMAKLNK